jgi:hypothetical protein
MSRSRRRAPPILSCRPPPRKRRESRAAGGIAIQTTRYSAYWSCVPTPKSMASFWTRLRLSTRPAATARAGGRGDAPSRRVATRGILRVARTIADLAGGGVIAHSHRRGAGLSSSGTAELKVMDDIVFEAEIIEWRGPAPYVLAVIPDDHIATIRYAALSEAMVGASCRWSPDWRDRFCHLALSARWAISAAREARRANGRGHRSGRLVELIAGRPPERRRAGGPGTRRKVCRW